MAFSQPYYFTHYQVEDGLSNNSVKCSLQDEQGFMWFGTRDGLNRFDGVSFKIFRNLPEDSTSIGCNAIVSLYEDDKKRLWVATEKGLFCYDRTKENFQRLKVAGDYSISYVRAAGPNIWYISLFTLYAYNEETHKLKSYKLNNKGVLAYCITKDETLWVATVNGTIEKYNPDNNTFTAFNLFDHSPYTVSKSIEYVFDTGTGLLLIGTSNQGLKSFDTQTGKYKDILTLDHNGKEIIVRDVIATGKDEYWVATQSGIFIINLKTGEKIQLKKELNDPYTISDNIVHTLCKDRDGGIWAGTYFTGLNYYPKQHITFNKYFPKLDANSISGWAVREICSDGQGNLWIGTEDAGLNKFNPRTGKFTIFNGEPSQHSISYSNIHGLTTVDKEVWAGTYLHGLDVLDINTGKRIKHYNTDNSSIGSNFIYSLFKTSKKDIIVATDEGLYQYNNQKKDFELVKTVPKVFYRTLYEDKNGTIWAGTYGDGVFYYNTRTGKHGRFQYEPLNKNSLANNLVNDIFQDEEGTIWFATEGGLCTYSAKQNTFKRYNTQNGWPSDIIYSILQDNKKRLWISTSKGLVCLTPSSMQLKVYTKSQGLLTDQFNYNSAFKDNDGRLYFGSSKGLIVFHPDSVTNIGSFSPPVYITGFQVDNEELPINKKGSPLVNSITYTKEIILNHNQSSFSIDFAALSFTTPGTIQYAYKMEGLEQNWTHIKTNRKIYFTQLKAGSYTFYVKAIDNDIMRFGAPAVLKIKILPPPWKSWWAYTLYIAFILSLTYFVIRYFYKQSKERHRRKLEKLEYDKERENYKNKIAFFTNVAHEIRTPLTLIKGPMENIMDRADEIPTIKSSLEIMNRNTDRLLQLSNQLLDFRKIEVNGFRLNFTNHNISEILNLHFSNFDVIARQKNINITTDFPDGFCADIDAEAFHKIISNLYDNAVKYARKEVHISFTRNESSYRITFKNDGHIIPLEMREKIFESFFRLKETNQLAGTGIGLTLARTLTQMHGGSLELVEGNERFNTFVLILPIHPKVAEDI
ncbi:MAG: two-component regulator propeller domain-containing protein [Niabella sp.]